MKRPHRSAHRVLWVVLAPLVLIGLYLAVDARPATPLQELPATDKTPDTLPPSLPANSAPSTGEQDQ